MNNTFLEQDNIERLMFMFNNEQNYSKYMKILWGLRELLIINLGLGSRDVDVLNPQYQIYEMINILIDALLRDDVRISIRKD